MAPKLMSALLLCMSALHVASALVPGRKVAPRVAPAKVAPRVAPAKKGVAPPRCALPLALPAASMRRFRYTRCAAFLCNPLVNAQILPFIQKHASTILCPSDAALLKIFKGNKLTPAVIRSLMNFHVIGQILTAPMLRAAKKGQGYIPVVPNTQIQKYTAQPPAALFLGPEGATTQGELCRVITPNIYISKTLVVMGCDNVMVPKPMKMAIRRV